MDQNYHQDNNRAKGSLALWFFSLHRPIRIGVSIMLVVLGSAIAYAVINFLWGSTHESTDLSKDRYVEVELSGVSASGAIRPGATVAIAPMITNKGNVTATAFFKLTIPEVKGEPAYTYEVESGWTEVDKLSENGYTIEVYGYGSDWELTLLGPLDATTKLINGATLRSDINGAAFDSMTDINIQIDGYLVEDELGVDPGTVWADVPQ